MIITIESTTKTVELNNSLTARIWEGETDSGISVRCMIVFISPESDEARATEFGLELADHRDPSEESKALPPRLYV